MSFPILFNKLKNPVFKFNSTLIRKMSGIDLYKVLEHLKNIAPLELTEKWDNTGLLLEPSLQRNVNVVLLTNDLTEDVVEEAIAKKVGLIISYHPPIFAPLKKITQTTWKERVICKCIEEKIALYSPHTTWDNVDDGICDWLSECLPLHDRSIIIAGSQPGTGMGRICSLREKITLQDVVESVKKYLNIKGVQLAIGRKKTLDSVVNTVAICAGSGASAFRDIKADLYLTGEMGHHDVLNAVQIGTSVILTNHSNSERGFLKHFSKYLKTKVGNDVSILVSEKDHEPLEIA